MSALEHVNPPGSAPPYKDLFSNVTIVPSGARLAFISSQWACDSSGKLIEGGKGDHGAQAKQTWTNIMTILKGLGCGMKDVVHKRNCFT
jgi:enamine deaminase RidA (YjgF/YER057c/UK114 family)